MVADSLCRSPLPGTFVDGKSPAHGDMARMTASYSNKIARMDPMFGDMFEETKKDVHYQEVVAAIKEGKELKDL